MPKILDFPAALELAGVTVRYLDGWEKPARPGYYYREIGGDPAGHMHHHTATISYNPNRDKANGYAGLGREGSTRLYQENYGDNNMFPVYTIANIYPAPISSGAGDEAVLEKVRAGIEVDGRSGKDTPDWYGNTHYWNTEWVLDGIGTHIDRRVWDMMIVVCQVQNDVMDWTRANHIGHGHHTRRKIDLRGGQFTDFDDTINHLRDAIDGGAPPIITPPPEEENMYIEVKYGDGFRASPEMKPAVAGWQGTTKLLGNPDGNSGSASGVDGVFGNGTKAATRKTQALIGVTVTGIADKDTRLKAERYLIDNR